MKLNLAWSKWVFHFLFICSTTWPIEVSVLQCVRSALLVLIPKWDGEFTWIVNFNISYFTVSFLTALPVVIHLKMSFFSLLCVCATVFIPIAFWWDKWIREMKSPFLGKIQSFPLPWAVLQVIFPMMYWRLWSLSSEGKTLMPIRSLGYPSV